MRTIAGSTINADALSATADSYSERGWLVATTANGISLITDESVCGIEVPAEYAADVQTYLAANALTGPVVEVPGAQARRIYLATGIKNAPMAIEALRAAGATVHLDGASIPLPPTQLRAGSARWIVSPDQAAWLPPVVAIGAAVRTVRTAAGVSRAARIAC